MSSSLPLGNTPLTNSGNTQGAVLLVGFSTYDCYSVGKRDLPQPIDEESLAYCMQKSERRAVCGKYMYFSKQKSDSKIKQTVTR